MSKLRVVAWLTWLMVWQQVTRFAMLSRERGTTGETT
jgi:hypothetical protein